jgi:hypothetical protein
VLCKSTAGGQPAGGQTVSERCGSSHHCHPRLWGSPNHAARQAGARVCGCGWESRVCGLPHRSARRRLWVGHARGGARLMLPPTPPPRVCVCVCVRACVCVCVCVCAGCVAGHPAAQARQPQSRQQRSSRRALAPRSSRTSSSSSSSSEHSTTASRTCRTRATPSPSSSRTQVRAASALGAAPAQLPLQRLRRAGRARGAPQQPPRHHLRRSAATVYAPPPHRRARAGRPLAGGRPAVFRPGPAVHGQEARLWRQQRRGRGRGLHRGRHGRHPHHTGVPARG